MRKDGRTYDGLPPNHCDSDTMSPIMDELPQVTLRHPQDDDITVPEAILRLCSPVLDVILRDPAQPEEGGNKILTIDDVKPEVLKAFVGMVTMNSYAPTDPTLTSAELAKRAHLLMPLIHKYDCKGFLSRLQEAVNAKPAGASIVAMCQYDMDSKWMQKETMHCVAVHLLGCAGYEGNVYSKTIYAQNIINKYKRGLDGLTPAFVQDLLIHVLTAATISNESTLLSGLKYIKADMEAKA